MEAEPEKPMSSPAGEPGPAANNVQSIARPIGELITDEDFPRSALGKLVDIGGYTGVVTDVVRESLKVRSPEGGTKSFNANGLRRIYGPVVRPEPQPTPSFSTFSPPPPRERRAEPEPPPPAPKPEPVIIEPDFTKPVRKIGDLVKQPEYPQCVLGEHVEIAGYTGVVVQIVNRSLKVRAQSEITRSYNADALRRLYG
jgi:hypothetical protein